MKIDNQGPIEFERATNEGEMEHSKIVGIEAARTCSDLEDVQYTTAGVEGAVVRGV